MGDDKPSSGQPDDFNRKVDELAADALEAGKKFVATDTGRKVAEATDSVFAKAEELAREAAQSDYGRKALDSAPGKQAAELARQADDWTKTNIPNSLARNVAIGAGVGVVASIVLPFGPLLWAAAGGALGFMRTVNKQR